MTSKDQRDDPEGFRQEVQKICSLYHDAQRLHEQGIHVVSTDEKTGIQALERIHPTKPPLPGKVERVEHEYKRHGTLCLIANFEVPTGRVIKSTIGFTRTEEDFASHIGRTIAADPNGSWIFIADQLNTHMSESLVRLVAKKIGYRGDLGIKGKHGILKCRNSRKEILGNSGHRIRFVYTPRHCSWLNQIEIWFSILARRVLKRGSFSSVQELRNSLFAFIDYFNAILAKPFKWNYTGRPLVA